MRATSGRRPRGAQEHGDEGRAHAGLGQHRAERRAVEPEVEAEDEHELEHDVDDVGRDDDDERGAQVGDAAQPPLAGQRDERHRHAERRDPQVARREVGHVAVPTEQRDERIGGRRHDRREQHAERCRQPQRLRGERVGLGPLAGSVQARDARGRPVREEDA